MSSHKIRTDGVRATIGFWLLMAATIALRFLDLGIKPPHFDEGINGHFVMTIWRDGFYTYDPTNFHGPLYFYLCHLAEIMMGRSVESFRVMNAVLATGLVFLISRFRRFVGGTAIVAAWILALSPAFSFYGRYAIHETLFILGQVAFVYGRFAWMNRPSRGAMVWMATGLVILISTKETFFIFLGTWFIAEIVVRILEQFEREGVARAPWVQREDLSENERRALVLDALAISGISVLVLAALFSGFFEHSQGIADFFRAFDFWSSTGTKGNGHEKPFFYWIELLARYEWPLLIGLVISIGSIVTLRTPDGHVMQRKPRLLLLFGLGHVLAYSLIPYKTPWLLLSFWPLAFWSLPIFNSARARSSLVRPLSRAVMVVVIAMSGYQAWDLSFKNYANGAEPYVYVQTTSDYTAVMEIVKKKLQRDPEARNMSIVVMIQDPWPLPYDLSLFPKMRYARIEEIDKDLSIVEKADLMLIDGSILEGLRGVMPKRFGRMKFQLRDAYGLGWALFDYDEFQAVLPPDVDIEERK